jgi:hypothetical protein
MGKDFGFRLVDARRLLLASGCPRDSLGQGDRPELGALEQIPATFCREFAQQNGKRIQMFLT